MIGLIKMKNNTQQKKDMFRNLSCLLNAFLLSLFGDLKIKE